MKIIVRCNGKYVGAVDCASIVKLSAYDGKLNFQLAGQCFLFSGLTQQDIEEVFEQIKKFNSSSTARL